MVTMANILILALLAFYALVITVSLARLGVAIAKLRAYEKRFHKDMRRGELNLARAIAEEGLIGEYRERALARIEEATRRERL